MPPVAPNDQQRVEYAKEARRIQEEALFNHAGHDIQSMSAEGRHSLLGVMSIVIASISGVASFSSTATAAQVGIWQSVLAGTLSFAVAAISGVITFLDPRKRAVENYMATNAYLTLRDNARRYANIATSEARTLDELKVGLDKLVTTLRELDDSTPIISDWAMAQATRAIAEGKYNYAIDSAVAEPLRAEPGATADGGGM